MSIEAMTWALSADVGDPTRKLVLIGWANHSHKDGRNAWASWATIADYVGCSTKTVGRHAKVLQAQGWIREGDQAQVSHIRPDRRPVVYDLAMTEAQRRTWAAEYEAANTDPDDEEGAGERPDNLSPRDGGPAGHSVPPSNDHDGTHDGTSGGTHGGTPMSDKPYEPVEPKEPPNPPHGGGLDDLSSGVRAGCRRHQTPADNCRGCGTTNRQVEARLAREIAEQRRLDQAAQFAADGGALRRSPDAVDITAPAVRVLLDQTRQQLRSGKAAS